MLKTSGSGIPRVMSKKLQNEESPYRKIYMKKKERMKGRKRELENERTTNDIFLFTRVIGKYTIMLFLHPALGQINKQTNKQTKIEDIQAGVAP